MTRCGNLKLILGSAILITLATAFTPIRTAKRPFTSVLNAAVPASKRNIVVVSHNTSNDLAAGLFDDRNLLHGRVDVLSRCVNSGLWLSNNIREDTSVFLMLFPQNITVEVVGRSVRELNPDERTTALCLQRTLLVANADAVSKKRELMMEVKRPSTAKSYDNPDKPGSLPKSARNALRTERKAREAMLRRINKAVGHAAPYGFIYHENETLAGRLDKIAADSSSKTYMLVEDGAPFGDRLLLAASATPPSASLATTLVLGDQNGYAECDEEMLMGRSDVDRVSIGRLSLLTSQCITICHHYLDMNESEST